MQKNEEFLRKGKKIGCANLPQIKEQDAILNIEIENL